MSDPSDAIIQHYERHAVAWDGDRRRAVWNDKAWHDRFLARLQPGSHVLDLGCGGGHPVAANLVAAGMRVTGVDSSPTMIELCSHRLPEQTWICADMRSLSLGRTFHGILAWDSFFHLAPADQRSLFPVFEKHAASSAVLMFNAGPAQGEAIGSYRGDPLYHASLDPAQYQDLLERHGFEILHHRLEDADAGGRTAWLARRR